MDNKKRLEEIKESYSNCIDFALSDGETLPYFDIEVADLNFLIQKAEKLEELVSNLKKMYENTIHKKRLAVQQNDELTAEVFSDRATTIFQIGLMIGFDVAKEIE
ncbi:hypothetical protein P4284_16125 [Bacillus swezeyi]|uniref:hypothetical protein n=1 Tax=Bacillus swezeyi TaxID=1925020 RepID=UPI0027DACA46|nr:hypothetical protein [Bacillus swezeyi]MED2978215.1 hypothetical protein [Bacillus swezeyi]